MQAPPKDEIPKSLPKIEYTSVIYRQNKLEFKFAK